MNNWQPIETAPKNEFVLVQSIGAIIPTVSKNENGIWMDSDDEPCPYSQRATHWKPLPSPPKETGRKPENRVRMTIHVKDETRDAIRAAKTKQINTDGKVVDSRMGKP